MEIEETLIPEGCTVVVPIIETPPPIEQTLAIILPCVPSQHSEKIKKDIEDAGFTILEYEVVELSKSRGDKFMRVLSSAAEEYKQSLMVSDPMVSARSNRSSTSIKSATSMKSTAKGAPTPSTIDDCDLVDVAMFLGGQSVIMRLEAPACVSRWRHFMGPFKSEEWDKNPECLRSRYRGEGNKSSFYGSHNELSARKELTFFFACKLLRERTPN
jgi:nucleoside diphosphate kinase